MPSKEDWMQTPVRCVGRMTGAVLAMTCALSIAAWAGGAGFGEFDKAAGELNDYLVHSERIVLAVYARRIESMDLP